MDLLKHYGVATDDSLTFEVQFKIPDNCSYSITTSGRTNYIDIDLNPGESDPSTNYQMYTEDFVTADGNLDLQFKQTQKGVTTNKPKISLQQS
jgi:hypothetical protein